MHGATIKKRESEVMYVQRNLEAHASNNCCRPKAISITYSECVFLALVIQHAKRFARNLICGLSGCILFLHIIPYTARSSGKKVIERTACFKFLYKFRLKHFSF